MNGLHDLTVFFLCLCQSPHRDPEGLSPNNFLKNGKQNRNCEDNWASGKNKEKINLFSVEALSREYPWEVHERGRPGGGGCGSPCRPWLGAGCKGE